ncbi:MAG: hypothetical protein ACPGJV_15440 [Bacteriovoracaceae bacterium]
MTQKLILVLILIITSTSTFSACGTYGTIEERLEDCSSYGYAGNEGRAYIVSISYGATKLLYDKESGLLFFSIKNNNYNKAHLACENNFYKSIDDSIEWRIALLEDLYILSEYRLYKNFGELNPYWISSGDDDSAPHGRLFNMYRRVIHDNAYKEGSYASVCVGKVDKGRL